MDRDTVKKIQSTIQLDIDAIGAYGKAIEKTDDPTIAAKMREFMNDHERHVEELSAYLSETGERPPDRKPDFKGVMIESFTSLRSMSGTEGALKAMKSGEKMTNKKYHDALGWDVPAGLKMILDRAYADEQRHLQFVEQQLAVMA